MAAEDDAPLRWRHREAASRFFLVCEHASSTLPARWGDLGLDGSARYSHCAHDHGAVDLALCMSDLLEAPFLAQTVSRLIYDCNRPFDAPDVIVEDCEGMVIPGNRGLAPIERRRRHDWVYAPWAAALDQALDRRIARGAPPVLATVHSFTPVWRGVARDVQCGIVNGADERFAAAVFAALAASGGPAGARWDLRRNEPYGPEDRVAHTLDAFANRKGLANVMFELRSDLLREAEDRARVAVWLVGALRTAAEDLAAEDLAAEHLEGGRGGGDA